MGDQNLNGCWDLNQRLAVAGVGKTIKAAFKVNRRECETSICSKGYLISISNTYTEENIIKER